MAKNRLKVMTANIVTLAAQTYTDSTDFVQIMQRNDLSDIFFNAPVQGRTLSTAPAGSSELVLSPIDGFEVGWLILSDALAELTIITKILQTYSIPAGSPFCDCSKNRVLPATGKRLSTIVCISPSLPNDVEAGTLFTFSVGVPSFLSLPATPLTTQRGVVS
jgi:hypothetical protein